MAIFLFTFQKRRKGKKQILTISFHKVLRQVQYNQSVFVKFQRGFEFELKNVTDELIFLLSFLLKHIPDWIVEYFLHMCLHILYILWTYVRTAYFFKIHWGKYENSTVDFLPISVPKVPT